MIQNDKEKEIKPKETEIKIQIKQGLRNKERKR